MHKLEMTRVSDTSVQGKRYFAAAPARVFAAHTEAELMRQWLLGPDGWVITICESDPRPGGKIHMAWEQADGSSGFSLTGEYEIVESPHRIVHIERMHLPETTPDNRVETLFSAEGEGTLLTLQMTVPSAEALESMLSTGMADGMEASYARLDKTI